MRYSRDRFAGQGPALLSEKDCGCQREIQRSGNLEKGHFLLCDRRGRGKKRGKWREICRYNGRKLRWCAFIVSILIFCEIRHLLRTRRKQIIDVS